MASPKKILNPNVSPEGSRSTGKGYLSVGLLNTAIKAYKPTDDFTPGFKTIHRNCGSTINQQIFCPRCAGTVEDKSELCKGIEVDKATIIPFEAEELDATKAEDDMTYAVDSFVSELDAATYTRSGDFRYIGADPTQPCEIYRVLFAALNGSGKCGLVSYTARGFNHRALLVADSTRGIFCLYDVLYADQIRESRVIPRPLSLEASPEELDLARKLIESMTGPAESIGNSPNAERLESFKAAKIAEYEGKLATEPKLTIVRTAAKSADLLETLKASLAAGAAAKKPKARKAA